MCAHWLLLLTVLLVNAFAFVLCSPTPIALRAPSVPNLALLRPSYPAVPRRHNPKLLNIPKSAKVAMMDACLPSAELSIAQQQKGAVLVNGAVVATSEHSSKMDTNYSLAALLVDEDDGQDQRNTLASYLAKLMAKHNGSQVPATTILNILQRMSNALTVYFIAKTPPKGPAVEELDNLLTLKNFVTEEREKCVQIRYRGECQTVGQQQHLGQVLQMSPEQIKDQRAKSKMPDIVWLFGTVMHLLIYKKAPLYEWVEEAMGDRLKDKKLSEGQKIEMLQRELCSVFDAGQQPFIGPAHSHSAPEKGYDQLISLMEECLKVQPEERITLDALGRRLHILNCQSIGCSSQSVQWD